MHRSFIFALIVLILTVGAAHPARSEPAPAPAPTPPIGVPLGTPTMTPPPLPALRWASATWAATDRAIVAWDTAAPLLCVGKDDAAGVWHFLACDGAMVVDLAPAVGDIYLLMTSGATIARLPLRGRVLLPIAQR
jgi:hypothetical protein